MAEVECRDCYDFKSHRYRYLKEKVIVDGKVVIRDCSGRDYYTYGDIFYCRQQIYWVREHKVKFQRGVWPDMPGVVMSEGIRKKRAEAHFVRACITHADVDSRLKKAKGDGKILDKEIQLGTPINEMEDEAKWALRWCEGWGKKNGSYSRWKEKKTYRQRRRNGSQGYSGYNPRP